MSLSPEARKTLAGITTATITTVLLKKGLRNVWLRGTRPIKPGQGRPVHSPVNQVNAPCLTGHVRDQAHITRAVLQDRPAPARQQPQ